MSRPRHIPSTDPSLASKARPTAEIIRRVSVYLRPYKLLFAGTMACAILSLAFAFAFPKIIGLMVDEAIAKTRPEILTPVALGLIAVFFLRDLFNSLRIRINNTFEQNVMFDMRRQIYARIQRLPVGFFDQRASGDLMTRVIEDVNSVERLLIDGTEQGTIALLSIIGVLAILFSQNATLACVALAPLPLLAGGALWYTSTAHRRYRAQREASSAMNTLLMDNLQGIRQIKIFGREPHEDQRFAARADDLRQGTLGVMKVWAIYSPAMNFAAYLGFACVLWVGGRHVLAGQMTHGQLLTFVLYLQLFYDPISKLHGLNQMLQSARAAAERVFDILDTLEEQNPAAPGSARVSRASLGVSPNDPSNPTTAPQPNATATTQNTQPNTPSPIRVHSRPFAVEKTSPPTPSPFPATPAIAVAPEDTIATAPRLRGEVQYHHVSFHYDPASPILRDINLHARPGQTIALVGPTGAGKTTILNLLAAFYQPAAGHITIDGIDTRQLPLHHLRAQISTVSQEAFLFNGTIRENILYGDLCATDEQLHAAAQAANCHHFIAQLPHGYDSRVGERGVKLSVGEKQRVSIARALLKDTPILILDEATASVDTATEKLIQQALERLMQNRTTFIIAHRLSTIRRADQILVIKNGQIHEQGTHIQLIAANGLYAQLTQIQNTTFIEESFEKLSPA